MDSSKPIGDSQPPVSAPSSSTIGPSSPLQKPEAVVPQGSFISHPDGKVSSSEKQAFLLDSLRSFLSRLKGGESLFEKALRRLVEQSLKLIPSLAGGKERFAPKTSAEWAAFFRNLKKMGHQKKDFEVSWEDVDELIFRGLMEEEGISMVVSDLKRAGQKNEEKYVCLPLQREDEGSCSGFMPGEAIEGGFEQSRLKGSVLYTRYVPQTVSLNDQEKRAQGEISMSHLKNEYNVRAQQQIEKNILKNRPLEPKLTSQKVFQAPSLTSSRRSWWPWVLFFLAVGTLYIWYSR